MYRNFFDSNVVWYSSSNNAASIGGDRPEAKREPMEFEDGESQEVFYIFQTRSKMDIKRMAMRTARLKKLNALMTRKINRLINIRVQVLLRKVRHNSESKHENLIRREDLCNELKSMNKQLLNLIRIKKQIIAPSALDRWKVPYSNPPDPRVVHLLFVVRSMYAHVYLQSVTLR